MVRQVLVAIAATGALSSSVTPVEKVIDLIQGLQKEVETEGKDEAAAYEKFACFCKDKTLSKSDSVKKQNDAINDNSADIQEKTADKKEKGEELTSRKQDQERLSKELDDTEARCAQEKATYDAENADVSKAISSLKKAIKAMKDSNTAASLVEIKSVVKTLSKTALTKKQQAVASLLQQRVDPSDPEYDFHSGDIIDLCTSLLKDFKDSKDDLDTEWGKTEKGCNEMKKSLRDDMSSNKDNMEQLTKDIERLGGEIAGHRESLIEAESTLKDDELYLKDLQARCEARANDYDQRSSMRGQEAEALEQAVAILSGAVKDADEGANKRALLQVSKAAPVSFLQTVEVQQHSQSLRGRAEESLALEAKKNRALDMLRTEGRRLGSLTIAALTTRTAADPFKKVKELIQKLVERLLQESQAEATKKGFCDTEMAKAEHDRDRLFKEAKDLNRELRALEAKQDELETEIKELSDDLGDESKDLKEVSAQRESDKKVNAETLATAREGLDAVNDAITVLKNFYSQAAKASFIQASPLDEDTKGAGFSGSYKGKQGGMQAVFALLETIKTDFERTIRTTEKEEAASHREFVEFSQTSKSGIAGKETKKELDEEDLKTTKTNIEQKMSDLQKTTDLLDNSLKQLEELKPTCVDTGMSYEDRVKKREEEMAALKKALCILDTDKVEAECQ